MILADKIIQLRKKNGWSQEELAEMLKVSRQSVSKWEGAQSTPDLDRIIEMSKIFSVSTDYLIKDEIEEIEHVDGYELDSATRRISMEDANDFLIRKEESINPMSLGVFLMIISSSLLLYLMGALEVGKLDMSENTAAAIGVTFLLLCIVAGITLIIYSTHGLKKYEFIEKEDFATEYGVTGMVKERKENFQNTYLRRLIFGISLCVLCVVPVLLFGIVEDSGKFNGGIPVVLLLIMVGLGVQFLMRALIPNGAYDQLLQIGEYSSESKRKNKLVGPLMGIYWMLITAVYLAYSFYTKNWAISWIIWPIAGILSGIIAIISQVTSNRK